MTTGEVRHTGKNTKVCFLALGAYPLLTGGHSTYVIGPQVLQALLATELAKRNIKVSVITFSDGGVPFEHVGGIEVIKTIPENPHHSFARRVSSQIRLATSLWKALGRARADVYFQQGGVLGVMGLFCRLRRKRFVVSVGSDAWVSSWGDWFKGKFKGFGFGLVGRFFYGLDIRLANVVIVMNESQRNLLKRNFHKDGVLIKHHVPITRKERPEKTNPPVAIWVGTICEVKQPKLFLELAEAVPQARFQMIGGYFPSDKRLYDQIQESAQRMPNFDFLGVIPFDKINDYFSRAAILVNTSRVEAYPPFAFIQAWMNYTPVVSLHDNTEEIVSRHNLGFHSKTFEQLVQDTETLLENEHLRKEMGENGRQYVEREHDINRIVERYLEVFNRP